MSRNKKYKIRKKKKEVLPMEGEVSAEGKYYKKIKKLVSKHSKRKRKKR